MVRWCIKKIIRNLQTSNFTFLGTVCPIDQPPRGASQAERMEFGGYSITVELLQSTQQQAAAAEQQQDLAWPRYAAAVPDR
jgi:hypothetical protein